MKKELFLSYFLCALCVLCGKIRRRFLGSIDAATKSGGNALAKHPGEPAQKPRLVSSNQLVLPNAQNPPACFAQCAIDPPVARFVAKDLGPPKRPILFGPCRMDRATVPETPVDKHRQLQLGKTKSGFTEKGRAFRIFLAETRSHRAATPTFLPVGFSPRLGVSPLARNTQRYRSPPTRDSVWPNNRDQS